MALEDDWGYQLAQQVLDAAVSCGADCPTRRVVPWGEPSVTCGTECGCELLVAVLEGVARGTAPCSTQRTAKVQVRLSVCWPPPEQNGSRHVAEDAGRVRDHATLRWQILSGILSGIRRGSVCFDGACIEGSVADCSSFVGVTGWSDRPTDGPCKLYELEFTFRSEV